MRVLRPYQQKTIDLVREEIRKGKRRILICLPTGAGKTHTMSAIVAGAMSKGNKVIALVHRRQLVMQMQEMFGSCGVDSALILAGEDHNLDCKCQIATIQTYGRRLQLKEIEWNPFYIDADVCLIDEAHHALSKSYQKVLSNYKDKIVIGVTATPTLASGVGMGEYFDSIVQPIGVKELIDMGFLVPGIYYGPSKPDLSSVPLVAGDWQKSGLAKVMGGKKLVGDVVNNWLRIAGDKQTMVFAVNRDHSKALVKEFVAKGVKAEHLDAYSEDEIREDTISRFRNGDIQVLSNVGLYTEGTDIQEIQCLSIARPTKSFGLFLQMVGRGARPDNGKENFIVIDHGGNVDRFGYYEDPIEWNLNGKGLAFKKKVVRKKEKTLMTCSECSFMFSGKRCPQCGKNVENWGKKIEAAEAELVEIGKTRPRPPTMEEKRKFYGMLEWWRRDKGYKEGWVAHKYRARYNCWPKGMKNVAPEWPDMGFLNWMKYMNIKAAKRREADNKLKQGIQGDMFNAQSR